MILKSSKRLQRHLASISWQFHYHPLLIYNCQVRFIAFPFLISHSKVIADRSAEVSISLMYQRSEILQCLVLLDLFCHNYFIVYITCVRVLHLYLFYCTFTF